MTNTEAINNIDTIFKEVAKVDDNLIKRLKEFELASLNLRIIDAHLGDNSGITPITDFMIESMRQMEEDVNKLKQYRKLLNESIMKLKG